MKENIAALMSAGPCSQRNHGRSEADGSVAPAAGHGPQVPMGPVVAAGTLPWDASTKLVEEEEDSRLGPELEQLSPG